MLRELTLHNFKSWSRIDRMRLAPITGLFGSNSSGKSSILQALLMLKQTAESPDRTQVFHLGDEKSLVNLGTFHDMAFGHARQTQVRIGLRWSTPEPFKIGDDIKPGKILFEASDLGFETTVGDYNSTKMRVEQLIYSVGAFGFRLIRSQKDESIYDLRSDAPGFSFKRVKGRAWGLPPPLKCYGFPDQVRAYFQNTTFLSDLELEFERMLGRIYYLGPLREHPQRQYQWSGAEPSDVGRRGERAIEALLASGERGLKISFGVKGKKRRLVEEYVAEWLKRLELIESFKVRPISKDAGLHRVWVKRTSHAAEVLITDVGFGVSQVLPVLVLCLYVPEGSTVILEQPEIHLHPSVQSGLADFLIDVVRVRSIQVVVESHSEHLLKRFQRRLAEGEISPGDVAFYFAGNSGGESRLEELNVDLFGNISNWPKDFFGDQFGEMAAMTEAAVKRQKASA